MIFFKCEVAPSKATFLATFLFNVFLHFCLNMPFKTWFVVRIFKFLECFGVDVFDFQVELW
jgi:hypothetical protein